MPVVNQGQFHHFISEGFCLLTKFIAHILNVRDVLSKWHRPNQSTCGACVKNIARGLNVYRGEFLREFLFF